MHVVSPEVGDLFHLLCPSDPLPNLLCVPAGQLLPTASPRPPASGLHTALTFGRWLVGDTRRGWGVVRREGQSARAASSTQDPSSSRGPSPPAPSWFLQAGADGSHLLLGGPPGGGMLHHPSSVCPDLLNSPLSPRLPHWNEPAVSCQDLKWVSSSYYIPNSHKHPIL